MELVKANGVAGGGALLVGVLAETVLAGALAGVLASAGVVGGRDFTVSGFAALLEITKRRRVGAVLIFWTFGLLLLVRGALFGTVTLRFNIIIRLKNLAPVQK
jgi:hypothetical protein